MIAQELGVSRSTVRNHLKSAFRKLGIASQDDLITRFRGALGPTAGQDP
jgi:DNA-binding CsgD family transcriptional regulator